MTDRQIDRQIDRQTDRQTDWLTVLSLNHKLTHWLNIWQIDWLTNWLTDWLTDWLTGWLADWLAGWLTGWLADWLAGWLTGWLVDWMTWMTGWLGWLADRLTDWMADWLTGWMSGWLRKELSFFALFLHIKFVTPPPPACLFPNPAQKRLTGLDKFHIDEIWKWYIHAMPVVCWWLEPKLKTTKNQSQTLHNTDPCAATITIDKYGFFTFGHCPLGGWILTQRLIDCLTQLRLCRW